MSQTADRMISNNTSLLPSVNGIELASARLSQVIINTPLVTSAHLSQFHGADISLKREDLQRIRSFKLRGAYNKISKMPAEKRARGVVTASAGNHSQGVAFACAALGVQAKIFMPASTPLQKIDQTKNYGADFVEIVLTGDTFDEAYAEALYYQQKNHATMVHPYDDVDVIEGQGTVALEILQSADRKIDFLFFPVGGGGLAAGLASYFKALSPETVLIGVEPEGAASMRASFNAGKNTGLESIDNFIDGAAVKRSGDLGFLVCKDTLDHLVAVPEGKVCKTLLGLYNREGMVVEPAGALSIAALDMFSDLIKGKHAVCIVSGGNNDIARTEEIKERALLYEGRKHYFVVNLEQRAGALKAFLLDVLGPEDDIVHFEYTKKTNRHHGPVVVGIETASDASLSCLRKRMDKVGIRYEYLNNRESLFGVLV